MHTCMCDILQLAKCISMDVYNVHSLSCSTFSECLLRELRVVAGVPIALLLALQVTDISTFTDDKKRAEVDAWLYETCTQCLQHIIDITVKFYPVVQPLMGRVLDLLLNFIRSIPLLSLEHTCCRGQYNLSNSLLLGDLPAFPLVCNKTLALSKITLAALQSSLPGHNACQVMQAMRDIQSQPAQGVTAVHCAGERIKAWPLWGWLPWCA